MEFYSDSRTLPPLYGKGTPLSERPKRPNCPKRPSRASPLGGRRVNFDQIVAAARQAGTLAPRASYWSFSWHETHCPVSEDGRGCTCTPEVTVQPLHARSEEHTSELQSLMRISYAVFCLKKKK